MQNLQQLTNRIAKLNEVQQEILAKFVDKLESVPVRRPITLDQIIDEFEREHPELLHLLAQ